MRNHTQAASIAGNVLEAWGRRKREYFDAPRPEDNADTAHLHPAERAKAIHHERHRIHAAQADEMKDDTSLHNTLTKIAAYHASEAAKQT